MKQVTPEVFLISQPQIDYGRLGDYLTAVGAAEWLTADRSMHMESGDLLTEVSGRLCYRSWEIGLNPNVTRIREDSKEYILNILKSGHGSVLEHANYTFILHNVSRILTHELVRHRAGVAVSQESMRFVRLDDIPVWFPDWALADKDLMDKLIQFIEGSEDVIAWMTMHFGLDDEGVLFAEKKHKTSFMRRFAPAGHATGLMMTGNIRALRHIIYMRTNLGAEEEIRIVCDSIARECLNTAPMMMQDYKPNEHLEWVPDFLKV